MSSHTKEKKHVKPKATTSAPAASQTRRSDSSKRQPADQTYSAPQQGENHSEASSGPSSNYNSPPFIGTPMSDSEREMLKTLSIRKRTMAERPWGLWDDSIDSGYPGAPFPKSYTWGWTRDHDEEQDFLNSFMDWFMYRQGKKVEELSALAKDAWKERQKARQQEAKSPPQVTTAKRLKAIQDREDSTSRPRSSDGELERQQMIPAFETDPMVLAARFDPKIGIKPKEVSSDSSYSMSVEMGAGTRNKDAKAMAERRGREPVRSDSLDRPQPRVQSNKSVGSRAPSAGSESDAYGTAPTNQYGTAKGSKKS